MENRLFPIFLKTEQARFLVIGGGHVGLEKISTLIKQNPQMTIHAVSISFLPEIRTLVEAHSNIALTQREFLEKDLDGADIVIVATNDKRQNGEIKRLANQRNLLVNAADQPELCDFYLGSIINKGSLKIAISTNGKSPVLARRLREYFTEMIPDSIEDSIESLHRFRAQHKGSFQQKLKDLNRLTKGLTGRKKPGFLKIMRLPFSFPVKH